ncbi:MULTISPECIES: hypothetical protein [Burkholderia]|uniref:Uncharacterized protein n=1 Tax=Burkholderia aenigmatica TaxID=2015348 RepID=A0A6J5IPQ3_9BURK|nr:MULTISPECIES: hypothetical protein [Burkholderia]CAB3962286.1 hypothetical protein BLA3211_01672 [Burkholderia aenigmatica]
MLCAFSAASCFPGVHYSNNNYQKIFVEPVWKVLKKFSHKTFVVNRETGVTNEKPEIRFFSGPDAAAKFDGTDGHYLTNNAFFYLLAQPSK